MDLYSIADYATSAGRIPILFFWRLLGSTLATLWYRAHSYAINIDEVPVFCRGTELMDPYLMADHSTTAECIPIWHSGGYLAQCHRHAGIRLMPTPSIFMNLKHPVRGLESL